MVYRDKLTAPFPQEAIKTREGKFRYVEGHTVFHRLNDATEGCWSSEIKSYQIIPWGKTSRGNEAMCLIAHVRVEIPDLGSREALGVQVFYPGSGEDMLKGAHTDGIKKAVTQFGVGLELYGPDYADDERDTSSPVAQTAAPPRGAEVKMLTSDQHDTIGSLLPQAFDTR